ncbi:MAG: sodium:proton antiporter [Betaproteobacteria bacterium]|nr:MAG: sodium:proton antiporter [Betaproteobacteria bacterium]
MNLTGTLAVTVALIAYGLVSRKLEGSFLTGPMLFTAFGLVAGPAFIGIVPLQTDNQSVHLLAEVTLILVLFSDAANINLGQLRRDHNLPVRMLLIGMPLTIALGAAAALLFFGNLGFWEAALLAAILVPTDAALGQAVVSNKLVPVRIRQALNVESGLNDGIALPFVLIFAALASAMHVDTGAGEWLLFGAKQVVLGPIAGIAVGHVGAKLVASCYRAQWMSETAEGMIALGLAFGAFALAELMHGNGFIAAFVAGLTFGNTLHRKCKFLYEFAESEGQILVLLTFAAFGAAMLPQAMGSVTLACIGFAIVALTVVRMLPVSLSLMGTGIKPVTHAFLGWFGPRGLASVLFVLLILEEADLENEATIFTIVIFTVALSVLLHGITAGPAARRYGTLSQTMGRCEERMPVSEEPFSQTLGRTEEF